MPILPKATALAPAQVKIFFIYDIERSVSSIFIPMKHGADTTCHETDFIEGLWTSSLFLKLRQDNSFRTF